MSDAPARSIPALFVMSPIRLPRMRSGTAERNTSMPGRTGSVDRTGCCVEPMPQTAARIMPETNVFMA